MLKSAADTELLSAIRAVAQGRLFVDVSLEKAETRHLLPEKEKGRYPEGLLSALSEREREVFELVARGHTNQEVADRLKLSVKSVETYRARLMDKLNLQSRAELVRYAVECGILSPGKSNSL